MPRIWLSLACPVVALITIACSSTSSGTSSGAGGNGGSNSSGNGGSGGGAVTSCKDINATACFSNVDCTSSSDHCTVKGTSDDGSMTPVACCVPGARGAGKGGDTCKNENDCQTAVCAQSSSGGMVCSPTCMSDSDCPMSLPMCIPLDPSIGKGSFCGSG